MTTVATAGEPRLNSIPETAARLGVGRSTVFELMAKGELRSVKIGHRRLVSDAAIAELIARLESRAA